MEIFGETIDREFPDLVAQGVRVRFIGRRDRAPDELQRKMASLERQTTENTKLRLWIAFDYGGRAEIVEAARKLVESGVEPREIDENVFAANLNAPEMPDPDLLIRTSGELRVSNFLLWQLAYTELVFVDRHWPDFSPRDLDAPPLSAYARRRRRFGGSMSRFSPPALLVAAVGLPLVLAALWAGGWWLFGLVMPRRAARAARVLRDDEAAAADRARGLRRSAPACSSRCSRRSSCGCSARCWRRSRSRSCSRGSPRTQGSATVSVGVTLLGTAWIGLGLGCVLLLRDTPEFGFVVALAVLLAVFADDTAAYFGGRALGRHKLAPAISPGKTWEGFVVGTLAAILVVFVDALRGPRGVPLDRRGARSSASSVALAAPLGDLFESMLKRDLRVKDSGRLLAATAACSTASTRCSSPSPAAYFYVLALLTSSATTSRTLAREANRAARRDRLDRPPGIEIIAAHPELELVAAASGSHAVDGLAPADAGRRRPHRAARACRAGRRAQRRRRLRRPAGRRCGRSSAASRSRSRTRRASSRPASSRSRRGSGAEAAAAGRQRARGDLPVPRRPARSRSTRSCSPRPAGRSAAARATSSRRHARARRSRIPTWHMGPKITIDSATLANKGLELIEAHLLFGLPYERIEVVMHPTSIVHALVRFRDGAALAHSATRTCACRSRTRSPIPSGRRRRCRRSTRSGADARVPGARRRDVPAAGARPRGGRARRHVPVRVQRRERGRGGRVPRGTDRFRNRRDRGGVARALDGASARDLDELVAGRRQARARRRSAGLRMSIAAAILGLGVPDLRPRGGPLLRRARASACARGGSTSASGRRSPRRPQRRRVRHRGDPARRLREDPRHAPAAAGGRRRVLRRRLHERPSCGAGGAAEAALDGRGLEQARRELDAFEAELPRASAPRARARRSRTCATAWPDAYWRQATWKRVVAIAAGPATNIVFARRRSSRRLHVGSRRGRRRRSSRCSRAARRGAGCGPATGSSSIDGAPVTPRRSRADPGSGRRSILVVAARRRAGRRSARCARRSTRASTGSGSSLGARAARRCRGPAGVVLLTGVTTRSASRSDLVDGRGREEIASPVGIVDGSTSAARRGGRRLPLGGRP